MIDKSLRKILITVIASAVVMILSALFNAFIYYGYFKAKIENLEKEDKNLSDQHRTDQQYNNSQFTSIYQSLQTLAQSRDAKPLIVR